MFRHVSQSGQTLGNISEKHRETSNVSEVGRKHFCFPGSKFCFCNNVSTGGQTGKHLRKYRESQMFPQQCFLVCPGLKLCPKFSKFSVDSEITGLPQNLLSIKAFVHPAAVMMVLRLQDTLFGVLRKIATARSISVRFSSNFHQMFVSACKIW